VEIVLWTESVEETREAGETIAGALEAGDVVSLTGEPGAGKTSFVQGAARGLGVLSRVVSPTFMLVREYEGRALHVHHVDVYRLTRMQDVIDLGFDEMVDSGGVTLIEWGDVIEGLFDEFLEVELTVPEADSERRRIRITPRGASWEPRMEGLEAETVEWAE